MKETPEEIARRLLDRIDESGYGTPKADRYTPLFHPDDIRALANAVLDRKPRL